MSRHFVLRPKCNESRQKLQIKRPLLSIIVLTIVVFGCLFCKLFIPKDPTYMDLYNSNTAPNSEFWFGTDTMGRDIFSMIWQGGRISLLIGGIATVISTVIAILFGTASGLCHRYVDGAMTRMADIFMSIPSLLLAIFIQSIFGKANVLSLSVVIGVTSWTSIARVVRTEVKQIKNSEYITASKCMGADFFFMLRKHFVPNLISPIMFMVVMNVRTAIAAEATLSFLGMGLPIETVSWGSMLSLSEKAMLSGSWWIIIIPGSFLVVTFLCLTNIGEYLRKNANRKHSNLRAD